MLDPNKVEPLHEPRSDDIVERLAADMRDNGWNGRPLLVIERESGYLAWTGSHRIAAARKVGLSLVPCYILHERELLPYDCDAEWGHLDDSDRLRILRQVGDAYATRLMGLEGRLQAARATASDPQNVSRLKEELDVVQKAIKLMGQPTVQQPPLKTTKQEEPDVFDPAS